MIYRIVTRLGIVYRVGSDGVTEIKVEQGLGSTRIYKVTRDNGNYIEINDPIEVEYTTRSMPLIPPGLA